MDVPGGTMSVRRWGRGRPILLIHGISADHTEWLPVAERLADDGSVVLPDLVGRGTSRPHPDARYRLSDEVERMQTLVDSLELVRPVVAGHSAGASVALALAGRLDLGGLVLVNPVTPWTNRPAILGMLRRPLARRLLAPPLRICRRPLTRYILTRRVYGERAPHIGQAVERYSRPYADADRARALLAIFADWSPADVADLPQPGATTRVIGGAVDRRIDPEHVRRWAERLGASFELVDGAGHGLPEEEPDRIAAHVRELIGSAEVHPREGRE